MADENCGKTSLLGSADSGFKFAELFSSNSQLTQAIRSADAELTNALLSLTAALLSEDELDAMVKNALDIVGTYYAAERAYILEFDSGYKMLTCQYKWNRADAVALDRNVFELPLDSMPAVEIAFSQKSALIIDVSKMSEENYPALSKIFAVISATVQHAVPFQISDHYSGFVCLSNPEKNVENAALLNAAAYLIPSEICRSRLAREQLLLTRTDSFTGFLNRYSLHEFLRETGESAIPALGVLAADINGLKALNRQFGTDVGDTLLQYLADAIKSFFSDCRVFRVMDDDFVVLCENIAHQQFTERCIAFRGRLDADHPGKFCVGYTWSDDGLRINDLISHASELLLIAKQDYLANRNSVANDYRPAMLRELLDSIEMGNYHMYLQPKFEVETGRICGAEALVRLKSAKFGLVSPARFIPTLENERYIRYIDFMMLDKVCAALSRWNERNRGYFPISLNLSRKTILEPDFQTELFKVFNRYSIPAHLIEIEIADKPEEMDRETIFSLCGELSKHGFRFAIDNFGAGFADISLLINANIDVLKLDRTLISSMAQTKNAYFVVKSVLELCRDANIESVAEGVETEEQLGLLKKLGCKNAQGYFFSHPMPLSDFERKYLLSIKLG